MIWKTNRPSPQSRRLGIGIFAALLAAQLVAAPAVALADPLTFQLFNPGGALGNSQINLSATGTIGGAQGAPLTVTQQFPTSPTIYTGTILTNLTQVNLGLPGGGLSVADVLRNPANGVPRQVSPNLNGATGTAAANYGLNLTAPVNYDIPPFDYQGTQIDLGVLQSVTSQIALRNVTVDVSAPGLLPLDPASVLPQTFDASLAQLTFSGNADVKLNAVLDQDNALQTFAIYAALSALASQTPDLGLTVSQNLLNSTVTVGYGARVAIPPTLVTNANAGDGKLEHLADKYRLTLPVNFGITPDTGLQGILDLNLAFSGQLYAQTDYTPVSVPEPSSIVLAGVATCGLALAAWRRRTKRVA